MIKKISKNIVYLTILCMMTFVVAMIPFQGNIALAQLPSSSNMRNSTDYSGIGTKINGETIGDPAYITTYYINGANQQVIAVPIYQGGYKVKGLWSGWSDWYVKKTYTNVTSRFSYATDGGYYYFEYEIDTQYEWVRNGKIQWSFSQPIAIFPAYKKTGNSRVMYRYRSKQTEWNAHLNKTVEYVPYKYSLYNLSNNPIGKGLKKYNHTSGQSGLTVYTETRTEYYITNIELAYILNRDIEKLEDSIEQFGDYKTLIDSVLTIIAYITGKVAVAGPFAALLAVLEVNDIYRSKLREEDINNAQELITAIIENPCVFVLTDYAYTSTTSTIFGEPIRTIDLSQDIEPYDYKYVTYDYNYVTLSNGEATISYITNDSELVNAMITYLKYKNMPLLPWNW